MGLGGADWLERGERTAEEEPDLALDVLRIQKGDVVADVGAGVGYFAWRLAERVGPMGRVYAVDIQPEMLRLLEQNMARRKLTNVQAVLGTVDDPKLPAGEIDLILMVDVYHEFSEPQKMLRRMRAALKPTGRMVLLEYRKEEPWIPIRLEHKMTEKEVRLEVESEGFTFESNLKTLPRQHILVFRPQRLQ
ncbi:MAG: class I SAM-dependent methyltransferase [Bryobacteraceae bacterium]